MLKQKGFKNDNIYAYIKVSYRQINTIISTAKERGQKPKEKGQIINKYVA